jgi:hypothetical protein
VGYIHDGFPFGPSEVSSQRLMEEVQIVFNEVREGEKLLFSEWNGLGSTCLERILEAVSNLWVRWSEQRRSLRRLCEWGHTTGI